MRFTRFGLAACAALGAVVAAPLVAHAQQPAPVAGSAPPAAIAALLQDLAQAEQKLIGLAEAIPEEQYGWRPAEGVRSVGEVVMHVAADNYFLPTFAGHAAPAETGIKDGDYPSVQAYEGRSVSKEQALQALRDSFAHLRRSMEAADEAFLGRTLNVFGSEMTGLYLSVITTTHLHEHLGQMIAYARSNGVVPPWSQ